MIKEKKNFLSNLRKLQRIFLCNDRQATRFYKFHKFIMLTAIASASISAQPKPNLLPEQNTENKYYKNHNSK